VNQRIEGKRKRIQKEKRGGAVTFAKKIEASSRARIKIFHHRRESNMKYSIYQKGRDTTSTGGGEK